MAKFVQPQINPFQVPQVIGNSTINSKYLFNNYDIQFTPEWWRRAVNNAIQYSNLTYLDELYSWCVQSSPFLLSQMDKRLRPLSKRNFAFAIDGKVNKKLTKKLIDESWWFKPLLREMCLSLFYGVRCVSVDVENKRVESMPLRNLDIFNKALRNMTYEYYNVVYIKDWDNMFWFEPSSDQDFRLGLLQPISRQMISIVETYNNWLVLGKRYGFPTVIYGYMANNSEAKGIAEELARNLDPTVSAIVPFRDDSVNGGKSKYQVEVTPIQSQSYPDAFRVYKELISNAEGEIMQLITGGTLMGATEKNTNSEQLAQIHLDMYNDILNADLEWVLTVFNSKENLSKLARLFKIPELERAELVEIPDTTISVEKFVKIGDTLAKQGMRFKPEVLAKVGMSADDIDTGKNNSSWLAKALKPKEKPAEEE